MAADITGKTLEIIKKGSIKIRVVRSGMFQQMTFEVKRVTLGNIEYAELFTERMIDMSELKRIALETGLPVEAQNGRIFPPGKVASDFQGL
jgi:hypothetical protein